MHRRGRNEGDTVSVVKELPVQSRDRHINVYVPDDTQVPLQLMNRVLGTGRLTDGRLRKKSAKEMILDFVLKDVSNLLGKVTQERYFRRRIKQVQK